MLQSFNRVNIKLDASSLSPRLSLSICERLSNDGKRREKPFCHREQNLEEGGWQRFDDPKNVLSPPSTPNSCSIRVNGRWLIVNVMGERGKKELNSCD